MEQLEEKKNQYGKISEVRLRACKQGEKTMVADCFFTAPFKIMSPFYKKDEMQVMLLTASAGIMEGDMQKLEIQVEEGAKMEMLSQSYEKIHKMEHSHATRETHLQVSKNAYLKYNPLPTIPFAESAFESTTNVYLEDKTSKFSMVEILSCGREARGERFQYRRYKNQVHIYVQDQLIYRDNTLYEPSRFPMEKMGFYEGYSHQANVLLFHCNCTTEWIEQVREEFAKLDNFTAGITRIASGDVVIRMLGESAQQLENVVERILG